MAIEIHQPELEALIRERMESGGFRSIEDALLQALKSSPLPARSGEAVEASALTGAGLVAAMQASPCKDIDLEPARS